MYRKGAKPLAVTSVSVLDTARELLRSRIKHHWNKYNINIEAIENYETKTGYML